MNRWVLFWSLASLANAIDPSEFAGGLSYFLSLYFALNAALLWKDRP